MRSHFAQEATKIAELTKNAFDWCASIHTTTSWSTKNALFIRFEDLLNEPKRVIALRSIVSFLSTKLIRDAELTDLFIASKASSALRPRTDGAITVERAFSSDLSHGVWSVMGSAVTEFRYVAPTSLHSS